MVNTRISQIALDKLAARLQLQNVHDVSQNEFMVSFTIDDNEIFVFQDGRAIIKNTTDESLAKKLYTKYIGELAD